MGWFSNGSKPNIHTLVRREAVIHLQDGTSIRGFLMDFYEDSPAVRVVKPVLLVPDQNEAELGGDALVFRDQIKFVQLL